MADIQWLLDCGTIPMRYQLYKRMGEKDRCNRLVPALIECPETTHWMKHLCDSIQSRIPAVHGSHDYRYENCMGKLAQLGMNREIAPFHELASEVCTILLENIARRREDTVTFGKIYSYYDGELVLAALLAEAGYCSHPAVQQTAEKRLNLLSGFTSQHRYDITVDGSQYPGVKKEWQRELIDPGLYQSGEIALPTAHDLVLLGDVYSGSSDPKIQEKLANIVLWHFGEGFTTLPQRYGYFYAPGGSYAAKAVCWKFTLPQITPSADDTGEMARLLHRVVRMSGFEAARKSQWFADALAWLGQFQISDGIYKFPACMLPEQKDAYWIFGSHMGMAEDRKRKGWQELLSTYWMSAIEH